MKRASGRVNCALNYRLKYCTEHSSPVDEACSRKEIGYGPGGHIVTSSAQQDVDAAQLLQKLLLLSAGLGLLRSRAEITGIYPKAAQFRSDYRALDRHLLDSNGTVEISG